MAYTNAAVEFRPELQAKVEEAQGVDNAFIGDAIFPVFPVQTRKGYYKRIKRGKGQLMANPGGTTAATDPLKRAPGTKYAEITRTTEQDSWLTVDRGLTEKIDDVNKQEESRFFDLEASTAVWLHRNMRISREVRIAAQVFSESNWTTSNTIDGTAYSETNIATINFVKDLEYAKGIIEKRGESVNTIVMSRTMWSLIRRSTLLRNYMVGANAGNAVITPQMFQAEFGLQLLVGRASYDTTKTGKDSSDSNLVWTWSDDYFWVGNVTGGAPEMGGAGRTVVLDELTSGQLFLTESWYDQEIRSTVIRVREDDDIKIVNELCGYLTKINSLS